LEIETQSRLARKSRNHTNLKPSPRTNAAELLEKVPRHALNDYWFGPLDTVLSAWRGTFSGVYYVHRKHPKHRFTQAEFLKWAREQEIKRVEQAEVTA
jgi:hypothetical protein